MEQISVLESDIEHLRFLSWDMEYRAYSDAGCEKMIAQCQN